MRDFYSAKPTCSVSGKPQASFVAAACLKKIAAGNPNGFLPLCCFALAMRLLITAKPPISQKSNHQHTKICMSGFTKTGYIFFFLPPCSHISAPLKPQTGAVSCDRKSRLFSSFPKMNSFLCACGWTLEAMLASQGQAGFYHRRRYFKPRGSLLPRCSLTES